MAGLRERRRHAAQTDPATHLPTAMMKIFAAASLAAVANAQPGASIGASTVTTATGKHPDVLF